MPVRASLRTGSGFPRCSPAEHRGHVRSDLGIWSLLTLTLQNSWTQNFVDFSNPRLTPPGKGGRLADLVHFLNHETHLPTFQAHAQAAVRLPGTDENQIGPGDFVAAAPAGAPAAVAEGGRDSLRASHGGLRGPGGMEARMCFPRGARLRRSSEFARVRTRGRHAHGRLMRVSAVAGPEGDGRVRHGIVTSRRVGCAVVRNRVRRRLREIIRCAPRGAGAWWVVTLAKPAAAAATFSELRDEWLLLARRLSILPAAA